jgi:ABC-type polysaccharide/polyol phosphate export permease
MSPRTTIELIRTALLVILFIGFVGAGTELLLLKHTEEIWQLLPLALLAIGALMIGWIALATTRTAVISLRVLMMLFIVSGGIGLVQHFRGNLRDAAESNPSLAGTELYREALLGATPALAPGTMIQFGLLGLVFTFRHPTLRGAPLTSDENA